KKQSRCRIPALANDYLLKQSIEQQTKTFKHEKHRSIRSGSESLGGNDLRRAKRRSNAPAANSQIAIHCSDPSVFPLYACRRDGGLGNDRRRLLAVLYRHASLRNPRSE